MIENWRQTLSFIWSGKEILRDHYKRHQYGEVLLPLCVLRRFDCVLEETKSAVLRKAEQLGGNQDNSYDLLRHVAGPQLYNTSQFTFQSLLNDQDNIGENLHDFVNGFSPNARSVVDKFGFARHIDRMDRAGILFAIIGLFSSVDLHPDRVSNREMGYLYEELVRVTADLSNEEAGEHFTPQEVIRLMVNLLLSDDQSLLTRARIFTVFDPAAGTGGMLSEAEERIHAINETARVHLFGQEVNDESWAVCCSDMMLKGHDASICCARGAFGNAIRWQRYLVPPTGTSATTPGRCTARVLGRAFWDTGVVTERAQSRRSVALATGKLSMGEYSNRLGKPSQMCVRGLLDLISSN